MTIILRETVRETIREIEIRDVERRVNRRERKPKPIGVAELDVKGPRLPAVAEVR